ncbi:MAG: DUF1998 domain-containing protein, partial [Myxococcales bacterium]|nr:DUF1998 domain-containing protein [Myxococcales bacterium]
MLAFAAGPAAYAAALPLDLAAIGPTIAAGLALRMAFHSIREAAPESTTSVAPSVPAAASAPDPLAVLRALGLVGNQSPTFDIAATRARPMDAAREDAVWSACGGFGNAPAALCGVFDGKRDRHTGVLIGDIPAAVEDIVTDAIVTFALLDRGERVLLICAEPRAAKERIAATLTRLGVLGLGGRVAGAAELKDALGRQAFPALVCLDLGDLSGEALGMLGARSAPWLASVGRIVLAGVERLHPIEATHLAFTARRLVLSLDAHRARPAWTAVGTGSNGTLRYVEQIALRRFERLPLGARSSAAARIFVRPVGAGSEGTILPEAKRAAAALERAAVDYRIEDELGIIPEGTFDTAGARRLARRAGYQGACSLSLLEDRHLATLFRARANLACAYAGGTHFGVWWVKESPVSRFLLEPWRQRRMMEELEARDELPSPRPVAGFNNRYLAAAHLEAAVHEGRVDEASLRRAFSDTAVDEFLAAQPGTHTGGSRARWRTDTRATERSRILVAATEAWPDARRETVTRNILEIRSRTTGEVLRRVDRRVAATRFYPHRVFRAKGLLHQLDGGGIAKGADHLLAAPADARAAPTAPDLRIETACRRWVGEVERHLSDNLAFQRGVAEITVREAVAGAMPHGHAVATVQYPAVQAEYETVAAVIFLVGPASAASIHHVARLADLLLTSHLIAQPEDVEVIGYAEGFGGTRSPALVFVDRNIGGMGVAEALDHHAVRDLLRWAWGVLYSCACARGCAKCTPPEVLLAGPDKEGALRLLSG